MLPCPAAAPGTHPPPAAHLGPDAVGAHQQVAGEAAAVLRNGRDGGAPGGGVYPLLIVHNVHAVGDHPLPRNRAARVCQNLLRAARAAGAAVSRAASAAQRAGWAHAAPLRSSSAIPQQRPRQQPAGAAPAA